MQYAGTCVAFVHKSGPKKPKHGYITSFFVEIPSKLIHSVFFEEVLFTFRFSYNASDLKPLFHLWFFG